jgi:hypothetical protein
MSEDLNSEVYEIFYYLDSKGVKYYTPSEIYASFRAKYYGTNKVYVEKN